MKYIVLVFDIQDNNYGPRTAYLGDNVETFQISEGKYACSIKFKYYFAAVVKTIKGLFSENDKNFKATSTITKGHCHMSTSPTWT